MSKTTLLIFVMHCGLLCSSVSFEDCEKRCSTPGDLSSVPCERGCRFYGLITATNEPEPLPKCHGDCKIAYKVAEEEDRCREGCKHHMDLASEEEPQKVDMATDDGSLLSGMVPLMQLRQVVTKTVNGMRMIQTRVIAFFKKDDRIIEVRTPTQVIIGLEDLEQQPQPRLPETGLIDSRVREGWVERGEAEVAVAQPVGGPRVRPINRRQHAQLMHGMLLLSCTMVVLAVLCYSCLLYRNRRYAKHNKQENIAVAIKAEPLKLVRPEDLTKLSLIDEDDLKSKTDDFSLPSARV